jgi:hypothetical protein
MLDISDEKDVGRCEIKGVHQVYDEPQSVFDAKGSTLSSPGRCGIVCINHEFSPISLWAERKHCRENIIRVAPGIKSPAFRKRVEQVKSQWIP